MARALVPVNADVPELDVSRVDDFEAKVASIGASGIGEIRTIGIGVPIAIAVFHAPGARVREVPIRPEMLIHTLPCIGGNGYAQ